MFNGMAMRMAHSIGLTDPKGKTDAEKTMHRRSWWSIYAHEV